MPPEPPHAQNKLNDFENEDTRRQDEAALDGYRPLSSHPVDDQDACSESSDSSSDDSEVDNDNQHHRIFMTIQWPEENSEEQASDDNPEPSSEHTSCSAAVKLDPSQDTQARTAAAGGPKEITATADHKRLSARKECNATDLKDRSGDRESSSGTGHMSEDQTEAVRRAMQAVRLPEDAMPEWARGLSDLQCQQRIGQMVAKITGQR
ncbi:uncharacterized protein LOC122372587 [Amphibalanus amphitrite]|uniref:uncharacterized protein LOC122372587 n=1 Tax=Amphibalanus amphitrite TaxID=1232801 RepID=UPI001C92179C|nr:uncharacterized protein LOC122372587 [Amphibalanus amphitrite]XP_043205904.1 uncharacterized protein LOC122372587 [Amphibalanus amphitrite]XP_043205905.1 uncharacterized protein LOC122372587 [Amphibalanus amphitrite]